MATRVVPLVEAAALLGMTPEAVRQRVKRGKTLRGTRRPDGWYVAVDQSRLVTTDHATNHDQSRPTVYGHDRSQSATATNHDQSPPDATAQLIAMMDATIIDLRRQLTVREQAEAELRRLVAAALQQRALPAPREESALPGSSDAPRPPWWARWWPWGR